MVSEAAVPVFRPTAVTHGYLCVRWPRKITACETPRCDHQAFRRNAQPALVQYLGIGVHPNKRFCKIGITCTGMHCLPKKVKSKKMEWMRRNQSIKKIIKTGMKNIESGTYKGYNEHKR